MPKKKEDFAFNSTGSIDDRLIISPAQRKIAGAVTGLYYICIYGNHTSSYRLKV